MLLGKMIGGNPPTRAYRQLGGRVRIPEWWHPGSTKPGASKQIYLELHGMMYSCQ